MAAHLRGRKEFLVIVTTVPKLLVPERSYACVFTADADIYFGNDGTTGTWTRLPADQGFVDDLTSLSVAGNNLGGELPSFAACTLLERFWCNDNQLTGTIPDFAPCTKLIGWDGSENGFTGYTAGSFATQKDLITLEFYTNDLPQSAVDAILADLVTSLGIPARAACTVTLQGNSVPSAAGLTDKATLISAGWTVTTD